MPKSKKSKISKVRSLDRAQLRQGPLLDPQGLTAELLSTMSFHGYDGHHFCEENDLIIKQQKRMLKKDKMTRFYFYCKWANALRVG